MSEEQFKKILGLRRFLFPNLPPTAGITEDMIDKRLKAIVDQPARIGNEILVLRMREENDQTVYWIEKRSDYEKWHEVQSSTDIEGAPSAMIKRFEQRRIEVGELSGKK
jgi:hypothetical protein